MARGNTWPIHRQRPMTSFKIGGRGSQLENMFGVNCSSLLRRSLHGFSPALKIILFSIRSPRKALGSTRTAEEDGTATRAVQHWRHTLNWSAVPSIQQPSTTVVAGKVPPVVGVTVDGAKGGRHVHSLLSFNYIQGKQQRPAVFVRICNHYQAVLWGPTVWVDQVAGLTSPTRGNKISTCQGAGDPPVLGAPGIGCHHNLWFLQSSHVHHNLSWARWGSPNTFWSIVSNDKVLRD